MGNAEKKVVIAVIGVGLIGGSLCRAFKNEGFEVRAVSSKSTIKRAMDLSIMDYGFTYDNMKEAVQGSDVTFICTPLMEISKILKEILDYSRRNSIVTDVGSTKSFLCSQAEQLLRKDVYFIGGHPMAGSEKRGLVNANPYLFYDAVWVLTPLGSTPKRETKRLSRLIDRLGAKVMILSPELHDRIAAHVSHLPQLLAVLLVNHLAVKNDDLYRNLAAGGFRDMTRIASSDFSIWRDIIKTNTEEIKVALEEYRGELSELIDNLNNTSYLERTFSAAIDERSTIPRYSKGFLAPLVDVRVNVKDRPGELAKITNIIYYRGINIKDIEIVNIREGEGGVLRLGFSEKRDAQQGATVLEKFGYEVIILG